MLPNNWNKPVSPQLLSLHLRAFSTIQLSNALTASVLPLLIRCCSFVQRTAQIPGWHTYHGAHLNPLVHFVSSSHQTMLSKQLNQACVSALLSSHLRAKFQLPSYIKRTNRQLLGSTYQMLLNCSISGWHAHHGVLSTTFSSTLHQQALKQWFLPFTRDVFINLPNGPLTLPLSGSSKR